ncbi:2TM domain-containing protein [Flavobacterium sp.]|uniref:2TM domain-containing protein n=1 Tax=Flavobacterium sp. TaxID=239 RepID=UPI00262B1648|nr:2TM domain-containing protein [Flavobacterium sp.]
MIKKPTDFYTNSFEVMKPDDDYIYAEKRVKKIKGFYTHVFVYVFINVIALVFSYYKAKNSADFWKLQTFWMAFSWGIGLVAHGLSVFGFNYFFSREWEERKIRKIIEEEKKRQNWE